MNPLSLQLPKAKTSQTVGTPLPNEDSPLTHVYKPIPRTTHRDTPRDPDAIIDSDTPRDSDDTPREFAENNEFAKRVTPPLGLLFRNIYGKNSDFFAKLPKEVKERFKKKHEEQMEKRMREHKEKMKQREPEVYNHNSLGHNTLWDACNEFLDEFEINELQNVPFLFKKFIQDKNYNESMISNFNKADHRDRESFVQDCLESIEINSNSDAASCLLYIVLGCYVENDAPNFVKKNELQTTAIQNNCRLLMICNALPSLLSAFQRHAFALLDGKEKDNKRVNIYSNILYIFLCTISWEWEDENKHEEIRELQYDLFDNERSHFIRILLVLLKESVVTNTNMLMPLKKIILLLWKGLYILLGKPVSDTENFIFGPHVRLKVREQDAQQFNDKNYCIKRSLDEVPLPVREAVELFDSLSTLPLSQPPASHKTAPPRYLLENPSDAEKLYRLLLPEFMSLIASLLLVISDESDVLFLSNVQNMNRYREITLKGVSSILFYLIKHLRRQGHPKQAQYVIQLLTDANAPVLILKILNSNAEKFVRADSDNPQLCLMRGEILTALDPTNSNVGESDEFSWRNTYTVLTFLRLLQKLTKDREATVHKLIQHKAHLVLKKVLKINQRVIIMYTCKIFKSLWRHLPAKWQQSHIEVVNQVYAHVKPLLVDNWLQGQQQAQPNSIQQRQMLGDKIREMQHEVEEFNRYNYEQWWKNRDTNDDMIMLPEENFVAIDPIMLTYKRTQVDERFTTSAQHYERMLAYLLDSSSDRIW